MALDKFGNALQINVSRDSRNFYCLLYLLFSFFTILKSHSNAKVTKGKQFKETEWVGLVGL